MLQNITPHMRKLYTFRYLSPDAKVYLINKSISGDKKSLQRSHIYSELFGERNAVIAYADKDMCERKVNELLAPLNSGSIYAEKVTLLDLEGHCNVLNMPLNVVLDEYCDFEEEVECREVFFYDNKKYDDEYSHLFKKRRTMP